MENKDIELVNKLNDLKQVAEKKCRDNNVKLSLFELNHYRELVMCRMKKPRDNKMKYESILYTIYYLLSKNFEYYRSMVSREVFYKFITCMIDTIEKSLNNDDIDIENRIMAEVNDYFLVEDEIYNGKISYFLCNWIIGMITEVIEKILITTKIDNAEIKFKNDIYIIYCVTKNWSIYEYCVMVYGWAKKRFEDNIVWEDWWVFYMFKVTKHILTSIDVTAHSEKVKKYLQDGVQESRFD